MEDPDLAGRRLGGFELIEPVGRGGFATVWRAHQLRLDRLVAVKVLAPAVARDPEAARRFEREGRAAASLDHPNVVPVYEAGDEDGLVYLAMRLVDGVSLEELLRREGPLGDEQVISVVDPVAAALDHAHEHNLIHRDVKPSNILIDDDRVWLSDFGIAATTRDVGRYTAGTIGTAAYMSPEQAQGREVDGRADLYALGCVVFECVTGHPPFVRDEFVATLLAHVNDPVPPSGRPELDAFFQQALAKDPAARFASGRAFCDALRHVLGVVEAGATPTVSLPAAATALVAGGPDAAAGAAAPERVRRGEKDERRRRRRGRWWWAAAALVLILGSAAVVLATRDRGDGGQAAPAAAEPRLGGEASAGVDLPLSDLNPHTNIDVEPLISGNVLPPLYRLTPDFEWVPATAAAEPELLGEDPQVVRYRLREDAVWDDGTAITTADVQATLDYLLDEANGAVGTDFYRRISDLTAEDDKTFTVTFAEPVVQYRALFSSFHPLLKKAALDEFVADGRSSADFLTTDIPFSGGPYRVVGFDPETSVRLSRNEAWWGEPPILDRVTARAYGDNDELVEALKVGDVDLAYLQFPDATQAGALRQMDDLHVEAGPSAYWVALVLNARAGVGPTEDVRVRQALALALDRSAIADAQVGLITQAPTAPLQSLVYVPEQAEYDEAFARYDKDDDRAGLLLDEAGWTLTGGPTRVQNGAPLTLRLLYEEDDAAASDLVPLATTQLVSELDDIGVGVEVVALPDDEFDQALFTGDFDLAVFRYFTNADPEGARLRFATSACPAAVPGCSGQGGNFGAFSDATVDALLDESGRTFDPATRTDQFHEIDDRLAELVPAVPLYQLPAVVAYDPGLTGVRNVALRGGPLVDLPAWGWADGD